MVKISAFHALKPHSDFIAKVPTKTYSQYSKKEIQLEIKNNPHSFLNIISQDTLDQKNRFIKIKQQFNAFKDKEILVNSNSKSIYIYKQTNNQYSCTGLICGISLNDYGNNKIKRHEKTIKKWEILFAEYLSINQIHAEPVLIAHDGRLDNLMDSLMIKKSKIFNIKTLDKVQHEVWEINNLTSISNIINFFKKTEKLYIADGHHRMASSFRNNKNQMCLAYIVSKNELKTHAFHRLISNINSPNSIIEKLNNTFKMRKIATPNPESDDLQFYINNNWHVLSVGNVSDEVAKNLQVTKLLQLVLKPIFGIKDERKNKNVQFIPGNINIQHYIKNNVKKNDFFFFMKKISINTIIKIAEDNQTTPPKSTFILPKIPSGLIMMEII